MLLLKKEGTGVGQCLSLPFWKGYELSRFLWLSFSSLIAVIATGLNFVRTSYQMLLVLGSTRPKRPRGMQG